MKTVKFVAAALVAAFALPALAQTDSTKRIDQRQLNQERRIEQGVKAGSLNEREAERLQRGQERVQKMEDKSAADGKLTMKERARIEHAQDKQSRRIYRAKHGRK